MEIEVDVSSTNINVDLSVGDDKMLISSSATTVDVGIPPSDNLEINRINGTLNVKREQATKLQGIIEYLNGIGVTLPKDESLKEDQK